MLHAFLASLDDGESDLPPTPFVRTVTVDGDETEACEVPLKERRCHSHLHSHSGSQELTSNAQHQTPASPRPCYLRKISFPGRDPSDARPSVHVFDWTSLYLLPSNHFLPWFAPRVFEESKARKPK